MYLDITSNASEAASMRYFPTPLDLDLLALCSLMFLFFAWIQGRRTTSTLFHAKLGLPCTADKKIWLCYSQKATLLSCSLSSIQRVDYWRGQILHCQCWMSYLVEPVAEGWHWWQMWVRMPERWWYSHSKIGSKKFYGHAFHWKNDSWGVMDEWINHTSPSWMHVIDLGSV